MQILQNKIFSVQENITKNTDFFYSLSVFLNEYLRKDEATGTYLFDIISIIFLRIDLYYSFMIIVRSFAIKYIPSYTNHTFVSQGLISVDHDKIFKREIELVDLEAPTHGEPRIKIIQIKLGQRINDDPEKGCHRVG